MKPAPPLVFKGPYYRYTFNTALQCWVPVTSGGVLVLTPKQKKKLLEKR